MNASRRDLFKFLGGTAMGAVLTPVPWRLITDAALLSETWPGVPRPARGEIRARFTNCSLCPAGCAVRARCVGEQPIAMMGVRGDPLSHGALCPFGLTGHHLPYHPERLKQGPAKEAAAAVADAIAHCGPDERVAVLDPRPGRTASWTYRRAMGSLKNGLYLAPSRSLGGAVAVNLANAKTVLSFGAPLMDGWGTPGNVFAARKGFRLIQAEPQESRTAVMADLWLPIRPGAENALALGIVNLLMDRKIGAVPAELADSAREFTPAKTAGLTGVSESQIVALANELAENGPALVLDAAESSPVLSLNLLLGAPGRTLVARRETPAPEAWKKAAAVTELAAVPDHSIRVLLIDESIPGDSPAWHEIEPKLTGESAVVVAFAWSKLGYGRHAKYVLPTAVYPEATDDIPPAVDSVAATFRISTPLVPAPAGMVNPTDFIATAAGMTVSDALRERSDAIQASGRGTVFTYADGKTTPVKEMKPDDFWKALNQGACWMDEAEEAQAPAAFHAGRAATPLADLPLVVVSAGGRMSATLVSPLMSKVYQESNLRLGPNRIALSTATAQACGIVDGGRATLTAADGRREVRVTVDAGLPPGVVEVGALDGCAPGSRAKVVRI